MSQKRQKISKQLTLVLFFLVLLGPMLFAWVLLQKGEAQQFRLTNHGDLVKPMQSITRTALLDLHNNQQMQGSELKGKWWLMYVGPKKCQSQHQSHFYDMQQIRTALGKDANRLERLFVRLSDSEENTCEQIIHTQYPQMRQVNMAVQDFESLLGSVSNGILRPEKGELYIIDPRGNIMMHYDPDMPARDILKDLKKLLKMG